MESLPNVLILDDDPFWLERHLNGLSRGNFNLYPTTDGCMAVEIARENNIVFGVIDEILKISPSFQEESLELQRLQGRGVIRKIRGYGLKTRFVFVTAAPIVLSQGDNQAFIQKIQDLRTSSSGIVSVINKAEIDDVDSSLNYENLIELIEGFSAQDLDDMPESCFASNEIYIYQPDLIIVKDSNIPVINVDVQNLTKTEENCSTNQPESGDDAMNPNSSISFDGANIGAANINSTVYGDQIGTQHNYAEHSDHHELALELRQLLLQIEQSYGAVIEVDETIIVEEIKTQIQTRPQLKAKIFAAIEAGGAEALKQLCQHPTAAVAIAAFEGWRLVEED